MWDVVDISGLCKSLAIPNSNLRFIFLINMYIEDLINEDFELCVKVSFQISDQL